MKFVERYALAVNSCDLRDDEHHTATHVLTAAALADLTGGSGAILGSLLARAKYADPIARKTFEAGNKSLAQLIEVWEAVVAEKGRSRGWMTIKAEWDIAAAHAIYRKIARVSLAHWLGGNCDACNGAKVSKDRRTCLPCGGSGRAPVEGGRMERDRVLDMVSELEGLFQAHGARASKKMRSAA